jgi:hypothetical protein
MKKLVKSVRGLSIRADGKVMDQRRSLSAILMFDLSSHASAAFLILCNRFLSALLQQSKLCALKLIVNF